jgi:hypothetical protein
MSNNNFIILEDDEDEDLIKYTVFRKRVNDRYYDSDDSDELCEDFIYSCIIF